MILNAITKLINNSNEEVTFYKKVNINQESDTGSSKPKYKIESVFDVAGFEFYCIVKIIVGSNRYIPLCDNGRFIQFRSKQEAEEYAKDFVKKHYDKFIEVFRTFADPKKVYQTL